MDLPSAGLVDGRVLGRTLDHTTASYKIAMAKSLFAHIASGGGQFLSYRGLLRGMLQTMWLPVARYKLRLGHADKTAAFFQAVPENIQVSGTFDQAEAYVDYGRSVRHGLLRYPVDIFLQPWLREANITGVSPATASFCKGLQAHKGIFLPYRIGREGIQIDPAFMEYVGNNLALLEGWADMALVDYLQQKNPNIPGIPLKIRVRDRQGLELQRRWWLAGLGDQPLTCVYTGTRLSPQQFHLDHFLPWRFVAHDRMWNLVPAAPETNMRKGAGIPDASLIPALADLHFGVVLNASASTRAGKDLIEEYVDDLGIDADRIGDRDAFKAAYLDTMMPLHTLARKRYPAWLG